MRYYIFCRDIGQFRHKWGDGHTFTKSLEYADVYLSEDHARIVVQCRQCYGSDTVVDEDEAFILELLNQ